MDKVLLYFSLKYHGNWDEIYQALDSKEKIDREELETIENRIDCQYMTIINPLYPTNLKNSHQPPFVLFYKGKIDLLVDYYKIFAFVYEEKMETCVLKNFEKMVKTFEQANKIFLLDDLNLMSNYINRLVKENSKNYILISSSINDAEYAEDALVISEAYELNQNDPTFSARLLINLATATIILEVARQSELLKLINLGLEQSCELFVLPLATNVLNRANNSLIKSGAKLIESGQDVLSEL